MPLTGHQVIPDRWEARHVPTAQGGMTGRCRITHPGAGVFDPNTGTTTATGARVYDGPCRIVALLADSTTQQAGQQVTYRDYLVQLPRDWAGAALARVDDTVTVTDSTDPALTAARLRVTDLQVGTLRFTRDLRCRLDQG